MFSLKHIRFFLFITCCIFSSINAEDEDFGAVFPVEIALRDSQSNKPIQRPAGLVAGLDTSMYIASVAGEILLSNIKDGKSTLLNSGGDDQRFGGICLDSRPPGTLYATGRDSGKLYAFNRRGELLRTYPITRSRGDGGDGYLTSCVQTRYQLLIADSFSPHLYYLPLVDEGPLRGYPAAKQKGFSFQGFRIPFEGDWEQTGSGMNAYGIEWSAKFNETAYIMNHATGQLFAFSVKKTRVSGKMRKVKIQGAYDTFPGALSILFDSTNEHVMYITIPARNAIAVIEFSPDYPRQAKFIRFLTNSLNDGPFVMGEFGDWIYPVSARFKGKASSQESPTYSMIQMPRHEQILNSSDPDEQFTSVLDSDETKLPPLIADPTEVQKQIRKPPKVTGLKAPVAIQADLPEEEEESDEESDTDEADDDEKDDDDDDEKDDDDDESSDDDDEPVSAEDIDGELQERPTETDEEEDDTPVEEEEEDDFGPKPIFSGETGQRNDPVKSDKACFPGSALVSLRSGEAVRMNALQLGDIVLVGWDHNEQPLYSEVFLFSHRDDEIESSFVQLFVSDGNQIEASRGHYLYANGKLRIADEVMIGDVLGVRNNKPQIVTSVSYTTKRGLYNPQTLEGNIVVNGIRASSYTTAVKYTTAVALMTPIRGIFSIGTRWSSYIISRALDQGGGSWVEWVF